MKRVNSLEEYDSLIKKAKERAGRLKTNSAMFAPAIQRYISLERFLYEETEAGVVFYSDEGHFYQAYYHINPEIPFSIERKDKAILLQNIYSQEKKPWMEWLGNSLLQSGFRIMDTMKQGVFTDYDAIPKIQQAVRIAERVFSKAQLSYAPLRRDQIPEMLEFRKTIREVPFWQFPYFTDDEYAEEAEAERLCCIMDPEGKIIGARHLIVSGKKAYGWVGIEDQYQVRYGAALIFLGHALEYIVKNDVQMCSWVVTTNVPSIEYHERLNTKWTGYYCDEWVLEAAE